MGKLSAGQDVCLAEPLTTIYPVLFLNPDAFPCASGFTVESQHIKVTGCKAGWLCAGWLEPDWGHQRESW